MRILLKPVLLILSIIGVYTIFSHALGIDNKTRVVVAGATGRTGLIVFEKLLKSTEFYPVALVKSKSSMKTILKTGANPDQIVVADITDRSKLEEAFKESTKVVMCTPAKPKIKLLSLIKSLFFKLLGKKLSPQFYFPQGGSPYEVDWIGARNLIDAAKGAGIKQFVFLSSMGGTQPNNFLNTIGRKDGDDKSGNILLWKRKAEKYLIESGMEYTIIHPGGLTDKKGERKRVVMGVDDELLSRKTRTISREDVAEVCIESLRNSGARNRSFDIISEEVDPSSPSRTSWDSFFSDGKNCVYE